MPSVAFFHDAPITLAPDGMRYSVGFSYDVWSRYLLAFDKVTVVTRQRNGKSHGLKTSSGPRVSFAPVLCYSRARHRVTRFGQIRRSITETLSSSDHVIARLPSWIGLVAAQLALQSDKPLLVELVGCPWDAYRSHSNLGKLLAPFMYIATRLVVARSSYVSYVTDTFLQRRYPTRGTSIACSDVILRGDASAFRARRLERFRAGNLERLTLGTIAPLDLPYKGHETVFKAIARIRARGRLINYRLVGHGDTSRLRSLAARLGIADSIEFVGPLLHDDISTFLGEIDVYIQPSKTEGLPRALLEAMYSGCPALGSTAGGIPELLPEDCLFSPGDVRRLAELLNAYTPDVLIHQAERNIERMQYFNPTTLNERRESFLTEFSRLSFAKPQSTPES